MRISRRFDYDDLGGWTTLTCHTQYGDVRVTIQYSLMGDEIGERPWHVDIYGADGRELHQRFSSRTEAYDFVDFAVEDWSRKWSG